MIKEAPKSPSGPYRLLDAWRGVAALWVLAFHACHWSGDAADSLLDRNPIYGLVVRGALGVVMFFVISGYCIAAAGESALRKANPVSYYLAARVRRIYPPYFASSIIAVLFFVALGPLAAHHLIPAIHGVRTSYWGLPVRFYFAALTLTQVPLRQQPVVAVYWSLCYEIVFYLIVGLSLLLLGRKSKKLFHIGLAAVTIVTLIWLILARGRSPFPLDLWYQFGLGAAVYFLLANSKDLLPRLLFVAQASLALIYAAMVVSAHTMGHPSTRMESVFTVLFAVLLLLLYRFDTILARHKLTRLIEWVGTFSYSLYLTHYFVIMVPFKVATRLAHGPHGFWVAFLAQIAFAVPVAYVFHLLFERPFLSRRAKIREDDVLAPAIEDPKESLNGVLENTA